MRDLRVSGGQSGGSVWRVILRVILGSILDHIWTLSEKPHHNVRNCLHLAVGRPLWLEYAKYGSLGQYWVVPGIAPPGPPSDYPTPGTPLHRATVYTSADHGVRPEE